MCDFTSLKQIPRDRVESSPGAGGGGDRELLCEEERGQRGVAGRRVRRWQRGSVNGASVPEPLKNGENANFNVFVFYLKKKNPQENLSIKNKNTESEKLCMES